MVGYLEGLLNVADVFISIFIITYSIFFLKKTHSSENRRPWEIMIIAIIFFLLAEIFTVLSQFQILYVYGLINVLKTLFIGMMLLTFSLNFDLIETKPHVCIVPKEPKKEKKSKTK